MRTAINVMGDAFGAGIVYHRSKKELGLLEEARSQKSSVKDLRNSQRNSLVDNANGSVIP